MARRSKGAVSINPRSAQNMSTRPADFSKKKQSISPVKVFGAVAALACIVTCLFGTVDARDRLVQRSTAAKAARGTMVRWCAENAIKEPADLQAFDALGYAFDPARSTDDCYVFVQK